MNAAKLLRLRSAIVQDELVLVQELQKKGIDARRNKDVSTQRSLGDVFFGSGGTIECQVTRKYPRFSYDEDKVKRYVGKIADSAFVMLGCKGDGDGMLFVLLRAPEFHEYLKTEEVAETNDRGSYYVLLPGDIAHLVVTAGDTIADLVQNFLGTDDEGKRFS